MGKVTELDKLIENRISFDDSRFNIEELKNNLFKKYEECAKKYKVDKDRYLGRYIHSLGVYKMALELNELFHLNVDKVKIAYAAIYHDYAKFASLKDYEDIVKKYNLDKDILKKPFKVLHACLGCYIVMDELSFYDEDVFNAIRTHTTGDKNMTPLQELIYISDCVEENRIDPYFVTMRRIAKKNYKKAIGIFLRDTVLRLKEEGKDLDELTIDAYNDYKIYCSSGNDKISLVLDCIDKNLVKDIKVYDAREFSPFFDFIVVSTALSNRQMQACISYLQDEFEIKGVESGEEWTLIDLGDIIVNIFKEEDRNKYALDRLYAHLPLYQE